MFTFLDTACPYKPNVLVNHNLYNLWKIPLRWKHPQAPRKIRNFKTALYRLSIIWLPEATNGTNLKNNCSFRSGASIFSKFSGAIFCSPNTSEFSGSMKAFTNRSIFFRSFLVFFKQTQSFQGTTKMFWTDLKLSGEKKCFEQIPNF